MINRCAQVLAMVTVFGLCSVAKLPAQSVGKNLAPSGAWIARADEEQPWTIVKKGQDIPADQLLLALPDASLVSANGAVKVTALADFDATSPLPILETAIVLHENNEVDLDLTLDRGRIDLTNLKKSGDAVVRLKFQEEEWTLTLYGSGTKAAVETFGRWPAGIVFENEDDRPKEPTVYTVILALKGKIHFKSPMCEYDLNAPPGPALVYWENVTDECSKPQELKQLPPWADPDQELSDRAKRAQQLLKEFRQARLEKGISEAIDTFYESDEPQKERLALIAMGAQDDLTRLGDALSMAKDVEVWDTGIMVARHWMGRKKGQKEKLMKGLQERRGYDEDEARTIIDLLHSFGPTEVSSPVLYQLLIGYLKHEKPAIRNLAAWHLYRLVPDAREKIPFKPNADEEEFTQAYNAWKEFLPAGKVPGQIGSDEPPRGDKE